MAAPKNLKLLFAISFAVCVAADPGDDFSNNLFSDLAPLLALFGERVTMQFMSQSMGWADNIIMAMAPLGIITAIVSAIRVGGPSWLKAIIGRARENLAAAEMDLMSSTSKEVCELWNRQEVVRCMGSAPVSEFICVLPVDVLQRIEEGKEVDPDVQIRYLDPDRDNHLEKIELNIQDDFHRWRAPQRFLSRLNNDPEPKLGDHSSQDIVILRNKSDAAPNISLNCHNQVWRGELRAAAVFGTIVQIGVLLYSGFATYYPTLKFRKGGRPIARYAFPCTAVGTLVLVAGMLLCAHVVESSTKEERYQAKEGSRARLVWLQQRKTVNDQDFDSFAVFTKDDRTIITTSRRVDNEDELSYLASEKGKSTASVDQSTEVVSEKTNLDGSVVQEQVLVENKQGRNTQLSETGNHTTVLAVKAGLGTFISLCGFIVQFIGLRGMHWSASIVQLGAVLAMTGLRAWVRRGLAKPPICQPLLSEFELDWFAMTLGDIAHAPWLRPSKVDNERHSRPWTESGWDWNIGTVGDSAAFEPLHSTESRNHGTNEEWSHISKPNDPEKPSKMHRVMMIRRDLGELADWRGPASAEAIALARAIEVTMDALFDDLTGNFTWTLKACGRESINFRLERQENESWKAYSDEIEAALSLWLYSVSEREQDQHRQEQKRNVSLGPPFRKDDAWLRAKGSPTKLSLRLLGSYTPSLHRDLWWWMPRDVSRIMEVEEDKDGKLEVENHRIVGCGSDPSGASQEIVKRTRYRSGDLANPSFEPAEKNIGGGRVTNTLLATESYGSLPLVYAQDMFSAFMRAAAKTLPKPVEGKADIQPDDISNDNAWQSFTLRNDKLSKIAQEIQSTGLGSLEDIYLSIIPPLSVEHKLPQADAIIELARQHAKRHEQLGHWKEPGDVYLWLFRTARTFPEQSGIATKATAVLMEYLRQVALAIELREAQHEESDLHQLVELKLALEKQLETAGQGVLSSLMRLYEEQGREWKCVPVGEGRTGSGKDTSYPGAFNFTKLQRLAQSSDLDAAENIEKVITDGENVNSRDIHNWTPLHYAAAKGSADVAKELLRQQADVNARNLLEWTPLHYACQRGETSIVRNLREGADINAQGRNGVAPLHCAAINGHQDVVSSLIESGAAIDILDASGNTPLLWAAYKGHKDVVKNLWPDANKRLRDKNGRTALHLAAAGGNVEVVKLLVEAGADKDVKGGYGGTPLHGAAANGHEAVARLLVEAGADKDVKKERYGGTPLHEAAANGHEAVARLLVEAGADKDVKKGLFGGTPLHGAAANGHEAVARLLVEAGADKDVKEGRYGGTPLHGAAANGHEAVARLLIEAGADKDVKERYGGTPLHEAAANGHEAVARLLVEAGADKDEEGRYGRTPLHGAAANGHEAVARLLVEAGADKDVKEGFFGRTPLHGAAANGHEAVARLLVEAGADKDVKEGRYGGTPLHGAAANGHEAVARLLVEAGADKDVKEGCFGRTPLHEAAANGHEAVARLLVEAGADKDVKEGLYGRTPLHEAAANGHEAVARLLEIHKPPPRPPPVACLN